MTPERLAQLQELVRLARAMRHAQRAYFKDRTKDNLIASKQAEAALDKALAALDRGASG